MNEGDLIKVKTTTDIDSVEDKRLLDHFLGFYMGALFAKDPNLFTEANNRFLELCWLNGPDDDLLNVWICREFDDIEDPIESALKETLYRMWAVDGLGRGAEGTMMGFFVMRTDGILAMRGSLMTAEEKREADAIMMEELTAEELRRARAIAEIEKALKPANNAKLFNNEKEDDSPCTNH